MPVQDTVAQQDPLVLLQIDIRESARRHIKAEAARSGKTMGEFLVDVLKQTGAYEPPEEGAANVSQ